MIPRNHGDGEVVVRPENVHIDQSETSGRGFTGEQNRIRVTDDANMHRLRVSLGQRKRAGAHRREPAVQRVTVRWLKTSFLLS
jgi:hypothetical protein